MNKAIKRSLALKRARDKCNDLEFKKMWESKLKEFMAKLNKYK